MKKLTALVALILCVTIGGVYATWFYAETTMDKVEHNFKYLGITDMDTSAKTGKISITDTMTLKIDDNDGSHIPGWDEDVANTNSGGLIQIRFIPNSGAATTEFNYVVSVENNTYGSEKIFDVANENAVLTGSFTYTAGTTEKIHEIAYAEMIAALTVNDSFELTTEADYLAYKTALDSVVLKLTITEVDEG